MRHHSFARPASIQNLSPKAKADKTYGYSDLIPAVRNGLSVGGKLYASPFYYAESSFLSTEKTSREGPASPCPLTPPGSRCDDRR